MLGTAVGVVHACAVVKSLEDNYWSVRYAAVQALEKLEPAAGTWPAVEVLQKLDDVHPSMR